MIKLKMRNLAAIAALATTLALAGCASTPPAQQSSSIKLEGIDSNTAQISRLYLVPDNGQTVLRGEVTRRMHLHGQIPGHLHVELISLEGKLIKEADISYKRKDTHGHDGTFELTLPGEVAAGSTIRVTHHDLVSHQQDQVESQWRDATGGE